MMTANHLCLPPAAKHQAFTTDTFPLPESSSIQLCMAVFKLQDSEELVASGFQPPKLSSLLLRCLSIL